MDLTSSRPTVFLATAKADAARQFYEQTLGFTLTEDGPYALVYQLAGAELRLSKVPQFTPLPFTVLDWQVSDIAVRVSSGSRTRTATFCPYRREVSRLIAQRVEVC